MTAPSRSQPSNATVAEEFGFTLWQERAPQGPWFLETPHDGHIFFGGDTASAEQCRDVIGRICAHVKENESLLVQQNERITQLEELAQFLVDRLEEFDPGDDQPEREFHGHVAPAAARLRAALQPKATP